MESTSQKKYSISNTVGGRRVGMEDDYALGGKEIPVENLARGRRREESGASETGEQLGCMV